MSSASVTVAFGFKTTRALGTSPHFSSGTGITPASRTAGCARMAFSRSREEIFSPPLMMMSSDRTTSHKKDIIQRSEENTSSLELEKDILAHPAVLEAGVIPVPDEKWGEVPKALVVLKPNAAATEAELIDFCRAHFSHYKCPRSFEFVASLPKTGTGKILKKDLRKKYWQGRDTIRPDFAAPRRGG